jgi:hypothetical protein
VHSRVTRDGSRTVRCRDAPQDNGSTAGLFVFGALYDNDLHRNIARRIGIAFAFSF